MTVWLAACTPALPTFPSMYLPPLDRPGGFSSLAAPSVPVSGHLYRPAGSGRAAGLVLLHGGHGLGDYAFEWADWLRSEGYVALAVDSLNSRAPGETRIWGGPRGVSLNEMAADAYGAMAYLRTLAFVDPDRIAIMGWSQGGGAAFTAVDPEGRPALAHTQGPGVRAVVGVYPICDALSVEIRVPILLLLGSEDYVTPRCAEHAQAMRAVNKPVTAKVYAGATHAFDVKAWDATYNRIAVADARAQVRAFLREHLQPR